MIRRPPRSTRTDTLFPYTTLFRSATEAAVSIGQIYRLFDNKDDVIIALVEENTKARIAEMHGIFGAVEQGKQSVFDAIKAIASISIVKSDGGMSFEILAEACRNPRSGERRVGKGWVSTCRNRW